VQITSRHNLLLQEIRRAHSAGRTTAEGLVAAEGPHLLQEALRGSWAVERVVVTPAARLKFPSVLARFESQLLEVAEQAFASVAATEHSQGVLALLRPRIWTWPELIGKLALLVVLDRVQDPGNAGTLVRSAEAFGATGVIFGHGSVHFSNSKFLRATAGSIFRLPFISGLAPEAVFENLRAGGIRAYALTPSGDRPIQEVDLRQTCALVTGSEGAGVSDDWLVHAETVRIPAVQVESLNAAVACSIALFEAGQQRSRL
jgi:TrmH family RNA methyltransferase